MSDQEVITLKEFVNLQITELEKRLCGQMAAIEKQYDMRFKGIEDVRDKAAEKSQVDRVHLMAVIAIILATLSFIMNVLFKIL